MINKTEQHLNPTIINLQSLFDLSDKLNKSDDEEFILNSVLLSLMGKLGIIRAAVLVPKNDDLQSNEINNYKVKLNKGYIGFEEVEYDNILEFRELQNRSEFELKLKDSGYYFAIPLMYKETIFGIICLGKKMTGQILTEIEVQYLQIVTTIAGNALQNSQYFKSLTIEKYKVEARNLLLQTLFELSTKLNERLEIKEILKLFSLSLMGQLAVNKFAFVEVDNKNNYKILETRLESNVISFILEELKHINQVNKLVLDDNNCLVFPIRYNDKIKAWLILCEKNNKKEYDDNDRLFIESLSNLTITALENQRLQQEELNKQKLESEMGLALEIQKNLLPKSLPELNNFFIDARSIPSKYVGGDYYDALQTGENKYVLTIADVSGKGVPASLLMANLQSALRILTQFDIDLVELTNKLNKIIYENTSADKFITFFICEIDLEEGTFHYLNAGHNPPIIITKDKDIIELRDGGIILGVLDEYIEYKQGEIALDDIGLLFLYTDGLVEAVDDSKKEYGLEKMKDFLINNKHNPEDMIESLVTEVNEYSDGNLNFDDLTMMLFCTKKGFN